MKVSCQLQASAAFLEISGAHRTGLMGSGASVEAIEKRLISDLYWDSNHDSSVEYHVA
jgi:hypothetical protein